MPGTWVAQCPAPGFSCAEANWAGWLRRWPMWRLHQLWLALASRVCSGTLVKEALSGSTVNDG